MSLATSIKDFSDTLNHIHTVKASSLPILPFLQELFVWSIKTILSGVVYIFTFEWFRDFSYLPLVNCEHLSATGETFNVTATSQQLEIGNPSNSLFHGLASPQNIKRFGNAFFTDPVSHLFSFFNFEGVCLQNDCEPLRSTPSWPKEKTNYMVSGLVNSFFFSLPFSLPHLISIRRLFSQGIQAAVASLLGSIAAHSLFLIAVFYGVRSLIIPWFSLEPLTYIVGFGANVLVIRELIQASPQRFQKGLNVSKGVSSTGSSPRSFLNFNPSPKIHSNNGLLALSQNLRADDALIKLMRIGVLNFVLTWCEELNIFSSITNLTLNAQNTYFDLYPSNDASNFFVIHTIYILAFIVGNCAFSLLFYYGIFKSGPIIASWTNFSSLKVSDLINKLVMLLILTFTFASFPYYGLDYLFGKIGGFLPEDPAYKETVLSPTKITVNKKNTLFTKAESADKKKHTSLIDINNFDNGVYLNNLDFNKFDNFPSDSKNSISRTTSFEKSNYRQENAWIRRNYLAKLRARPRKNNNTSTASLYKAFKDPKAYYHKIQLESDKKQNKSIREEQAKNREQSGYFVQRQEGVLVNEVPLKVQQLWNRVLGLPKELALQTMSGSGVTHEKSNKSYLKNDQTEFFGSNTDSSGGQKDSSLSTETKFFAENYTKGIQKINSAPSLKKTKSLSTKNVIKRKFFLNPVYRTLLQTDIDTFIARQPVTHNISENQSYDLYKKRVILQKYYDWLRYYSPLQTNLHSRQSSSDYLYDIGTTKSFADSVFHHQFKGTLKIAKRLFPVTFDPQQNIKKSRVLSYDQILYKDLPTQENPLLHEELLLGVFGSGQSKALHPKTKFLEEVRSSEISDSKKSFDQRNSTHDNVNPPSNKKSDQRLPNAKFEELDPKLRLKESSLHNSPFIEESDSSPFYAGWDDTLRRFVITNNFAVD